MAQIIVRKLEESVKRRLRQRAKSHGRSMEEEARVILRGALGAAGKSAAATNGSRRREKAGFGTRFASHFAALEERFELAEWNEPVRPPRFRR